MKIEIAGLPVEWQTENTEFISGFASQSGEPPVMTIGFDAKMPECHGIAYSPKLSAHVLRNESGEILCADEEWKNVTAYYTQERGDYALPLAAMCSRFAAFNTLLFHASCVELNGKSVIFTGNSGVGKTTQAKLWQKHLGAEIINGDKIFVREINGFYACGLAWKGSSEFCLNRKASLAGIIVLRQAKENRLTLLGDSAAQKLLPHVFLPHWDSRCLDSALNTFEKIIGNVPVYLLECRPDEAAVRLVYETLPD